MKPEAPFRVTIESHGKTFTAELPWDADMEEITTAIRGLLVSCTWPIEVVDEYIKPPE